MRFFFFEQNRANHNLLMPVFPTSVEDLREQQHHLKFDFFSLRIYELQENDHTLNFTTKIRNNRFTQNCLKTRENPDTARDKSKQHCLRFKYPKSLKFNFSPNR